MHFLALGTILGLSAGLTPGPLLTLVISETLHHDVKSGVKVAVAPLLSDFPIIALTLFLAAKLSNFHAVLGGISLAGGLFILYLGYESIRSRGLRLDIQDVKARSLTKGIVVNVLNPHPYLFWLSVGAPTLSDAMNRGAVMAVAFIGSFYVLLVGSKIALALLVGRSRSFLTGRIYLYTLRILGLLLWLLALVLFRDGLYLLGIL